MSHYLGWYVLDHGFAMCPDPTYIAWCFGVGALRAAAEAMRGRDLFSLRDDAPVMR
jgi:hypothetical protein